MTREYEESGYLLVKQYFSASELRELRVILLDYHESWKNKNADFYTDKAVNSAYLTSPEHLDECQRRHLFKFIGSTKLMNVVASIMKRRPTFMNTQLFFNPVNKGQKNYWHRDPQYHLTIEEQKEALLGPDVIHFRIPLLDEPGVGLVPGTHKRWDTREELEVRLENNGRKNDEALSTGVDIGLEMGDLLVFSANMIHRGLYGMDRLSFDILFCDPEPGLATFARDDCLPSEDVINSLEYPDAFRSTVELKTKNKR